MTWMRCLQTGGRNKLIPFQSFHELRGEAEQRQTLNAIAHSLKPNGRFICTLHNPTVRLQSISKGKTDYGPFPRVDEAGFISLSVELNYEPETGIVRGWQTIYELDLVEQKVAEHRLPIQFSLIQFEVFKELFKSADFEIEEMFGNYDFSPFVPETSPYIIVCSRKLNT